MNPEYLCHNCGVLYANTSQGSLDCSFHPRPFNYHHDGCNFPKNSYDCCGGKLRTKNQSTIDLFGRGCQRIDHVSSDTELKEVLAKPYVCLKRQGFQTLQLHQTVCNKEIEIIELTYDGLDKNVYLLDAFNETVLINLRDEYAKLFNTVIVDEESPSESSEIYYRDDTWDLANMITEIPKSAEFFIVRKIEYNPPAKKRVIHVKVSL